MGLDMSLIRKRKGGFKGRPSVIEGERLNYRVFYDENKKEIGLAWPEFTDGKIKYTYQTQKLMKECSYYEDIMELAYWRKANAIHKWFVDNVQKGKDNCKRYRVKKGDLEALLDVVNELLDKIVLKKGKVINGQKYKNNIFGKTVIKPNYEKGKIIKNWKLCEKLLPTQEGFFFGGTQYNEYYYEDLKYTKERLELILNNYDLRKERIYYTSSW